MNEKPRRGSIDIREDLAPLYIISFIGVPTDPQFDAYLEKLTRITMRLEARALIYDASGSHSSPPSHRKKMADWMRRYEAQIRTGTVGTAFVLPSAITRGVLTAILWVQPMACPHHVVATLGEAKTWCLDRLNERLRIRNQSDPQGR